MPASNLSSSDSEVRTERPSPCNPIFIIREVRTKEIINDTKVGFLGLKFPPSY